MIVSKFVEPITQRMYRGKLVASGGLRNEHDFNCILEHFNDRMGSKMLVLRKSCHGCIVIEIHNNIDYPTGHELENCRMESFEMNEDDAYDFALTLLNFAKGNL